MQEGPRRQTSGAHRRGRAGATQRETEPDTSGGRRQTARETGTARTGAGAGQARRRAETGRDRGAERQGDGGEGRRCLGETEGWRKSEREMERDRGREREVERQGMGSGWGAGLETQRYGGTAWQRDEPKTARDRERLGVMEERDRGLRDREMEREMHRNRGTGSEGTNTEVGHRGR